MTTVVDDKSILPLLKCYLPLNKIQLQQYDYIRMYYGQCCVYNNRIDMQE